MTYPYQVFRKHTLILCFLFAATGAFAQKTFDLYFEASTQSVDGNTTAGFVTTFDFSREEVRKGWWKFAKKFGNPLDMRTYYQVKIPASQNDGEVDIYLYAVSTAINLKTKFYLGSTDAKLKEQVASILHDFKKWMYIQYYADEMEEKEKHASVLAERYIEEIENREEILNQLLVRQQELKQIKNEIRKIEIK